MANSPVNIELQGTVPGNGIEVEPLTFDDSVLQYPIVYGEWVPLLSRNLIREMLGLPLPEMYIDNPSSGNYASAAVAGNGVEPPVGVMRRTEPFRMVECSFVSVPSNNMRTEAEVEAAEEAERRRFEHEWYWYAESVRRSFSRGLTRLERRRYDGGRWPNDRNNPLDRETRMRWLNRRFDRMTINEMRELVRLPPLGFYQYNDHQNT